MPHFAIRIVNDPNAAAIRAAHLPHHHRYLATHAGRLLLGGATLDADETHATGALYVIDCENIEAAQKFAAEDPLTISGSRREIVIEPWRLAVLDSAYVFGTERAGAPIPGQAPPRIS